MRWGSVSSLEFPSATSGELVQQNKTTENLHWHIDWTIEGKRKGHKM
jgi:hypothetical protein